MTISQFSRACLLYNVIVTSYMNGWFLFWYRWKKYLHTYKMGVNLGLNDLHIDNPEGGCNNPPPSENMLGKMLRRTRVNLLFLKIVIYTKSTRSGQITVKGI